MKRYIIRQIYPMGKTWKTQEDYKNRLSDARSVVHLNGVKWSGEMLAVPKDVPNELADPIPSRFLSCEVGRSRANIKHPIVAIIYMVDAPVTKESRKGVLSFMDAQRILHSVMQRDAAMLGPLPEEGNITTLTAEGKAVAIHWKPIPGGSSAKVPHLVTMPIEMVYALMSYKDANK